MMKRNKMKSVLSAILCLCVICVTWLPTVVRAQTLELPIKETSKIWIQEDGEIFIFATEADRKLFTQALYKSKNNCFPGDPYYPNCKDYSEKYRDTYVKSYSVKRKFLKFLTNSYEKVAVYNSSNTNSIGVSIPIIIHNITFSLNIGYSATQSFSLPADGTRYSKLGAFVDYDADVYKREILDEKNKVIRTFEYLKLKNHNFYREPVYR